jgi:hypothetical protein
MERHAGKETLMVGRVKGDTPRSAFADHPPQGGTWNDPYPKPCSVPPLRGMVRESEPGDVAFGSSPPVPHPPALRACPLQRGTEGRPSGRAVLDPPWRGVVGESRPGGVVFRVLRTSVEIPVAQSPVYAIVMFARRVGF